MKPLSPDDLNRLRSAPATEATIGTPSPDRSAPATEATPSCPFGQCDGTGWVVERVRGYYFELIAPIRQAGPVNRVERVANVLFQEPEIRLTQRAVINRIFERVAVSILGLPLHRTCAALEDATRRVQRDQTEHGRIKAG